ncbi:flagellar export chaperone FliS [Heliobacterium chlorum]|uniref:Flagellar secretion chaperone FliS n=2 Tax=Heliobacterium chlorum TaxID=2698 RepID=A0ABR7T195_HELCL|nr:flagellar export chaperone FliS [Heliobacterium chlorum]
MTENYHQQQAALAQYRNTTVQTAAPEKLLIMLYDGAIRFLQQAVKAIETKDFNDAHEKLLKAQNIVVELMVTLNMDYEISKQLKKLYDFFYQQLVQANIKKETKIILEVVDMLTVLRNTWDEAAKLSKSQSFSGGR